jgi:hypothetical protein
MCGDAALRQLIYHAKTSNSQCTKRSPSSKLCQLSSLPFLYGQIAKEILEKELTKNNFYENDKLSFFSSNRENFKQSHSKNSLEFRLN